MSSKVYGSLALLSLTGTAATFFGGVTEIVGFVITIGANCLAVSLAMKDKYKKPSAAAVPTAEEA